MGGWVVAVGSPLGLEQTVTAGIVSGKGRPGRHVQMSGKRVRGYIQTDAKINPGNGFNTLATNLSQMSIQALPPAGGSLPHNNMMPYLTVYFIIALQGVFPPRS